ncbi:acyltransferase family protein [Leptospira fluminis]|nr:acyltransferase family protein [Leptospira fluminis]
MQLLLHKNAKYRPDIDGLRAVAVLLVVGFHAFPEYVSGGFIGVDVFFVISGFLISGIIFDQLNEERFSLKDFYSRRINRLFPALIVVLVCCGIFGWFILLPAEYKNLGKHTFGGSFFLSNIFLWREAGYFDSGSSEKPLLHLWSLGIEEQFYILWPFLLMFVWKKSKRKLELIVALFLISFLFEIGITKSHPVAAFYSPLARFWELFLGAVLAAAIRSDAYKHWIISPRFLSLIGLGLIFSSAFLLNEKSVFPGWRAIFPSLGAVFVISDLNRSWLNRNILSNKMFVFIGLISFPIYLWHWPILSFVHILEGQTPTILVRTICVFLSLFFAVLTYRYIESPLRIDRRFTVPLICVMIVLGGFGFYTFRVSGLALGKKEIGAVREIAAAIGDRDYPQTSEEGKLQLNSLSGRSEAAVLFLGDSHMEHYWPRLKEIYSSSKPILSSTFATCNSCPFLPNSRISGEGTDCGRIYNESIKMARESKYVKIAFSSYWDGYEKEFVNSESIRAFGEDIRSLVKMNKDVYVLLSSPADSHLDPKLLINPRYDWLFGRGKISDKADPIDKTRLISKNSSISKDLAEVIERNGGTVIDPFEYFCSKDVCPKLDGELPIYSDSHHLRPFFVIQKAIFLDEIVLSGGR